MREIKFRAWDKQFKEWVDPDIVGRWAIFVLSNENSFTHEMSQFTGLKDKNGKEIYEGDIVKEDIFAFPVTIDDFHGYRFLWGTAPLTRAQAKYGEVIGNIYENPELLK